MNAALTPVLNKEGTPDLLPKLTVFFIVEPPEYQIMACYLAASLREHFGQSVALVGYCPDIKIDLVDVRVKEILQRLNCDLRGFAVEGRFEPPYPHGNKLLATLEKRDTEFSAFMDSDVLCIRANNVDAIVKQDCVSLTPAASMIWGTTETWDLIYDAVDMRVPTERIRLMRQKGNRERVPYFSSGLFTFPENHRNAQGKTFPECWMDMAQSLDTHPDVPGKRPYLDQISLPLAIQKADLGWNILPDEQHYILGGRLRGEPLPADREIFTIHYRKWNVLKEISMSEIAKDYLQKHSGVRRVQDIVLGDTP
jgi:hypothetical protein